MTKLYRQTELTYEEMDNYVFPHVLAMTGEKLHSKHEIAEELGARDKRIEELEKLQVSWIDVNNKLPESSSDTWSKPVIAICDAGLVYKLSCMGECWQRTLSFANNASTKVVGWIPMPQSTQVK